MAEAVFYRAQTPLEADVGATVENDLAGAAEFVRQGWDGALAGDQGRWAMLLLDLCFYTGAVTAESHRRAPGMPEGHARDEDPSSYFGLTLLDTIHRKCPELPIFIFSSKPRNEVSLEFSQRGALGFIARDDLEGSALLKEALWQHGLLADSNAEIIGNSLPMLLVLREARRAFRHGQNILIRGERGTGKELLARYLHRAASVAAKRPFVPVNSAIFTPSMFASELFGIEPKTATGVDAKIGLIESANGGDLFLDEIADMPAEVQAAFLRVLQERQITRVGAREPRDVDVRFLSATNAEIELDERRFRPDLLDRLRLGGSLWLPPLRERKADICLLAESFVREAEKRRPGTLKREITSEALAQLTDYDWPGNIRELRTCAFEAVNRHPDVEHLVPNHLRIGISQEGVRRREAQPKAAPEEAESTDQNRRLTEVLADLRACDFPPHEVGTWAGQLNELQQEQARLLARYLHAALDATKRRTPKVPHGQIQIHPAVKLITGDSTLSASKAADIVKRVLGPLEGELAGALLEAYTTAVRLRPKTSRKTNSLQPG
jgi:DNA-binding NtrC family response regulator